MLGLDLIGESRKFHVGATCDSHHVNAVKFHVDATCGHLKYDVGATCEHVPRHSLFFHDVNYIMVNEVFHMDNETGKALLVPPHCPHTGRIAYSAVLHVSLMSPY